MSDSIGDQMVMEVPHEEPQTPTEIIEDLLKTHDRLYCLYSGGGDSACTTHFIEKNYPDYFAGVLHSDTDVYLQMTRDFVLETARKKEWNFHITRAPPRKDFSDPRFQNKEFTFQEFILRYGFPGPYNHGTLMGWIKYYGWRHYLRQHRAEEPKAALIGGTRKKESFARLKMREYTKLAQYHDSWITFCQPFLFKDGQFMQEYFVKEGLHKSPSYRYGFDISGDCACGAYAQFWERELIRQVDWVLYDKIVNWEKMVREHGTPNAKKHAVWGRSEPTHEIRPKKVPEGQQTFQVVDAESALSMMICGSDSCNVDPFRGEE